MPRFSPVAADALRAVGAVGGTALIVAGTYDTRWIPFLGCLAVAALSTTEFALARTRRFLRETEARTARQAELVAARAAAQALPPAAPPEIPPPAVRPPAVRPPAAPTIAQTVAPTVAGPPFADGRQLGADALLRLLEAVHREVRHAHEAADRAQAELADLSREWNALVQESMSPPPHARPPYLTPPHLRPPQVRAPAE